MSCNVSNNAKKKIIPCSLDIAFASTKLIGRFFTTEYVGSCTKKLSVVNGMDGTIVCFFSDGKMNPGVEGRFFDDAATIVWGVAVAVAAVAVAVAAVAVATIVWGVAGFGYII